MKTKITILFLFTFLNGLIAQVKQNEISLRDKKGQPKLIRLKETKISSELPVLKTFLKNQYKTDEKVQFKSLRKARTDKLNFKTQKLQQYYNDIKVEFAVINTVSENNELKTVNGKYVDIKNLNTVPELSESEALQFALNHIGAEQYMWEIEANNQMLKNEINDPNASFFPKGELVIIEKNMFTYNPIPVLAYRFNIYATRPLSRDHVYVDAATGEVVFKNPLLMHVDGTAETRYSGTRTIATQQAGFIYRLRDYSRGNGIETYNLENQNSNGNAVDFMDVDNNWTVAEYDNADKDNAALDAHWGAMMTYDYFLHEHQRNSFDGNGAILRSYVHHEDGLNADNAYWDGERMLYGDGYIKFDALTSLDIVAHEIGHAFYWDLVGIPLYGGGVEYEPGAINEGLSDIWGAMVEFYVKSLYPDPSDINKETYLQGEEVRIGALAERSMRNPKEVNSNPDTYMGDFWNKYNTGIHSRSTVLSHWFYLLAEGSVETDGINDNGDAFNIVGIGKTKAAAIVYRAEGYFTPTTGYLEAKDLTIQAAQELYGTNSIEAITTHNAWYAVGIGNFILGYLIGDDCTCFSTNSTYTFETVIEEPLLSWEVSSNLQIVSSSNTEITVKAINSYVQEAGFVKAHFNSGPVEKDIWVGKPATPASILGSTGVAYGALVNYQGSEAQGASSYNWHLPYPYIVNPEVVIYPNEWRVLSGKNTRYLNAQVGSNNGLLQFMGVNKCGEGSAKITALNVMNGGGLGAGGGNGNDGDGDGIYEAEGPMPFTSTNNYSQLLYPNPVDKELIIVLGEKELTNPVNIVLYDISNRIILNKNVKNAVERLDMSIYPNGIYILHIVGNDYAKTKKIIIQH